MISGMESPATNLKPVARRVKAAFLAFKTGWASGFLFG
jgi:hypothetical protein